MNTLKILTNAEISPSGNLGRLSVRNRAALVDQLRKHRRVRLVWICVILVVIVAVVAGSIALAVSRPERVTQGLLPYLGGSTFLALLELARRMVKDYSEGEVPLILLEHATESQVAEFLDALIEAQKVARPSRPQPVGTSG